MRLKELINLHLTYFKEYEKEKFRLARSYYRGEFWEKQNKNTLNWRQRALQGVLSKNIIFPIAESAVSALVGSNPKVDAMGLNELSEAKAPEISSLTNYILRANGFRGKAGLALIDAILTGRFVFKTGWNAIDDMPVVTVRDPATVFFDMTARTMEDLRYIMEATLITWGEFVRRVKTGKYKIPAGLESRIAPCGMPDWMIDAGRSNKSEKLLRADDWMVIWEVYSMEHGIVVHYSYDYDLTLFAEKLEYVPYSLGTLNPNGVNNAGLSEVQLVLEQQDTINDMLSLIYCVAYKTIPRIIYDKSELGEQDINGIVETDAGDYVGVTRTNYTAEEGGRPLGLQDLFAPGPEPGKPQAAFDLFGIAMDNAQFISAMAEAARGQVVNARTATEMAVIDAQLRTRNSARAANFADVVEDMAKKAYWLSSKYMKYEKRVKITGANRFVGLSFKDLRELDYEFDFVPNNPMRLTPSVQAELITQLQPLLQDPAINKSEVIKTLLRNLGFEHAILPQQEATDAARAGANAAAVDAAQQAGAQIDPAMAAQAAQAANLPPQLAGAALPAGPTGLAEPAPQIPNQLPEMTATNEGGQNMAPAMGTPNVLAG